MLGKIMSTVVCFFSNEKITLGLVERFCLMLTYFDLFFFVFQMSGFNYHLPWEPKNPSFLGL